MSEFFENFKSLEYNNKTIYYCLKDINIHLRNIRGKEMAKAFMMIFDENKNQIDLVPVYDEEIKVINAMPFDAKKWYEEHINDSKH